jgi:hypothetical protein
MLPGNLDSAPAVVFAFQKSGERLACFAIIVNVFLSARFDRKVKRLEYFSSHSVNEEKLVLSSWFATWSYDKSSVLKQSF